MTRLEACRYSPREGHDSRGSDSRLQSFRVKFATSIGPCKNQTFWLQLILDNIDLDHLINMLPEKNVGHVILQTTDKDTRHSPSDRHHSSCDEPTSPFHPSGPRDKPQSLPAWLHSCLELFHNPKSYVNRCTRRFDYTQSETR